MAQRINCPECGSMYNKKIGEDGERICTNCNRTWTKRNGSQQHKHDVVINRRRRAAHALKKTRRL